MFLYTCRNLKCIGVEQHVTSRYFRDECKKNHRFLDIFKKLRHQKKPSKSLGEQYCRRFKRFPDNEKEIENGSVSIKLSPTSVPKNGTINSRK